MLGKFILKSYQLTKSMKWIPSADLFKYDDNSSFGEITDEFQIRDKEFETKEEADKFISDILTERGYIKG